MKKNIVNIFMTTDEKYARYMAVSIASILYNTESFCKFFVLADNVSDFKKKQIEDLKSKFDNFEIVWIDLKDKDREEVIKTFISKSNNAVYTKNIANYSRFLMPDMLKDIEKALYLDTDILVYGDIAELYNYDLAGFVIGGVADSYVVSDAITRAKVKKYISPNHVYFNAGILLIDCNKWRKQKIYKKIAQSDDEIFDKKCFNSQDPINKCFENNYCVLPHKFNWFGVLPGEDGITKDIVIRHFPGDKPDVNPSGYDFSTVSNFYFFASMTSFAEEVKLVKTMPIDKSEKIIKIKLFGFIPFLKITREKIYLFNFIKILKVIK